jgi:hypothetical protein
MGGLTFPSYYYTQEFVSPQQLYAEVKEEMKSYFATAVVDDTMFPIYTTNALQKLGRGTLRIDEALLELENNSVCLPADFKYMREVWACQTEFLAIPDPRAVYSSQTYVIAPYGDFDPCEPCACPPTCSTKKQVVTKTTGETILSFDHSYKLSPGSRSTLNHCANECSIRSQNAEDTFHIEGNKLFVTFTTGFLHIVYYKLEQDESDFQLIPDNYRIQEYLKAFIKYKMYEQIFNEVSDESFSQVERKYQIYKQEYNDAFISADAEVKKETLQQKVNSIHAARRRMNKYLIR